METTFDVGCRYRLEYYTFLKKICHYIDINFISFVTKKLTYTYPISIKVGKGPQASEVSGIVKIGQTMTMVIGVKDDENKFDMMVSNKIVKIVLNKLLNFHFIILNLVQLIN